MTRFVKRAVRVAAAIILALLLSACGGSKRDSLSDLITTEDWINVNDGDSYAFYADGSGKHETVSLKYTLDTSSGTVYVTEGVATLSEKAFTLETEGEVIRLVPEDMRTFYVRERDYEKVSAEVRRENERIITETKDWIIRGENSTQFYASFESDGTGKVWLYYKLKLMFTGKMTWEMLDNDTVKLHFSYAGKKYEHIVDVVNDNGEYTLRSPLDDSIYYYPDR